ncbi:hypothetical protein L1887_08104 [Cichorium endivia]|nr:hypothetical protein L1887_08104 [Cichorium endivia]
MASVLPSWNAPYRAPPQTTMVAVITWAAANQNRVSFQYTSLLLPTTNISSENTKDPLSSTTTHPNLHLVGFDDVKKVENILEGFLSDKEFEKAEGVECGFIHQKFPKPYMKPSWNFSYNTVIPVLQHQTPPISSLLQNPLICFLICSLLFRSLWMAA